MNNDVAEKAVTGVKKRNTQAIKENITGYLFMAPLVLGLVIFVMYPLLECFWLSMFAIQPGLNKFVGLNNFKYAFNDPLVITSVMNTFQMAILNLLLTIPGAFIIASLINSCRRGKNFFKVSYYLPNVTSIIAISLLFKYIFYTSEQGIANYLLSLFGISPVGWFSDPRWAQFTVSFMSFWQSLGSNMLICLAGLQSINRTYYEAAEVDGATGLKKWWYITVPSSKPILVYLLVMVTMSAMKRFGDVWMIGGQYGSPAGVLRTIVLYMYTVNFENYNVGYASAIAVILFLIILILTIINTKLVRFDSDN
jgi:multiple sugar transport system permease protein/cellobiose transport system permease protein